MNEKEPKTILINADFGHFIIIIIRDQNESDKARQNKPILILIT